MNIPSPSSSTIGVDMSIEGDSRDFFFNKGFILTFADENEDDLNLLPYDIGIEDKEMGVMISSSPS